MPNWCYNAISISTKTPKQFAELIQGIMNDSEQPFDFNRIIPMPEELRDTEAFNQPNANELKQKYGFTDWYDWSSANWNTKWNACEVEFTIETSTNLSLTFNTAWSPPTPVIEKIAELFPFASIEHKYEESGMGYWGEVIYENGNAISSEEGEIDCEYRWKNWGECMCEEDCGICDCDCGCEQNTKQTICTSCNENDHQNNNNLSEYKTLEKENANANS